MTGVAEGHVYTRGIYCRTLRHPSITPIVRAEGDLSA